MVAESFSSLWHSNMWSDRHLHPLNCYGTFIYTPAFIINIKYLAICISDQGRYVYFTCAIIKCSRIFIYQTCNYTPSVCIKLSALLYFSRFSTRILYRNLPRFFGEDAGDCELVCPCLGFNVRLLWLTRGFWMFNSTHHVSVIRSSVTFPRRNSTLLRSRCGFISLY